MRELTGCLSDCLQAVDKNPRESSSALRGFRYAFGLSLLIWTAGGAAVISGCASNVPAATFTSANALAPPPAKTAGMKVHCGDIPLPPRQFDHAPTIRTFVTYVPYGQVGVICRAHGVRGPAIFADRTSNAAALVSQATDGGFEMKACSWKDVANLGFVVLPKPSDGDVNQAWEACALRHEYAHINGWSATHPNAHYEDS